MNSPDCGHSACTQNYIDTASSLCLVSQSAMLAGLRLLQHYLHNGFNLPLMVQPVLTNCDTHPPITVAEIDTLCEEVNAEAEEPGVVVTIEGGVVQDVTCTVPARVRIIEFDSDTEEVVTELPDGTVAIVTDFPATVDKAAAKVLLNVIPADEADEDYAADCRDPDNVISS